ncbi:hypothetical protein NPIL_72331 [Nephila pilipes]|uniref:Uncharacterized protein n=1 Tax=Nephila pilipes TaxID=299642 RepID=A0A8X6NIS9_NEPPI|nr:hypothetical protein NPIL_72331 [Nephila pilipes]
MAATQVLLPIVSAESTMRSHWAERGKKEAYLPWQRGTGSEIQYQESGGGQCSGTGIRMLLMASICFRFPSPVVIHFQPTMLERRGAGPSFKTPTCQTTERLEDEKRYWKFSIGTAGNLFRREYPIFHMVPRPMRSSENPEHGLQGAGIKNKS